MRIVSEIAFKSMTFMVLERIGLGEFVQDISRTLYLMTVGVRLGAPWILGLVRAIGLLVVPYCAKRNVNVSHGPHVKYERRNKGVSGPHE